MKHVSIILCISLMLWSLLSGCNLKIPGNSGNSCTHTSDCEEGLLCIDHVCSPEQGDPDGDADLPREEEAEPETTCDCSADDPCCSDGCHVDADGVPCNDDNNACNGVSTCLAGACVQTTDPVTCTAMDECHIPGTCDPATGQCSSPAGNEGAVCNYDNDACNGISTCQAGSCVQTTEPVTCAALDECHVPGTCDPATGECTNPVGHEGEICDDDADACNGISTCMEGSCVQTTPPVECTALDECHIPGVCYPATGECSNPVGNEGGLCNDDENACNGISTCQAGACIQTTDPVACTALDECHVPGTCDPATGQCSNPVGNEDAVCNDDNDICNGVSTCLAGACVQTTDPVTCTAMDECHIPGTCDPATGECSNPVGNEDAVCNDDNDICNGVSTCVEGSCVQTTDAVECTAMDECHAVGTCDPTTGQCSNPAGNEGEACNEDNNICNGTNICFEGRCIQITEPIVCQASDDCHLPGECDPATGQCSNPVGNEGGICNDDNDDNDACNGVNTCRQGACLRTTEPVVCTAMDECHLVGVCDTATGQCTNPIGNEGGVCNDDGIACNGVSTCQNGICVDDPTPDNICVIDSTCYETGQENPENQCYICDPQRDTADWSLRGNDDGWCIIIAENAATCFVADFGFCPEEVFNGTDSECLTGSCGQCGQALIGGCTPGMADCDGSLLNGCETALGTLENCGSCGDECSFINNMKSICNDQSQCEFAGCEHNYADCDNNLENGCEVFLPDNDHNCGICSHDCTVMPDGACHNGMCYNQFGEIPASRGDCDQNTANGQETNLESNIHNCGECGYICPDGTTCRYGYCYTEDYSLGDCDRDLANGAEFNLQIDNAGNCGGCNYVCPVGSWCIDGLCHNNIRTDCNRNYYLINNPVGTLDTYTGVDTSCGNCEAQVDCTALAPPQVCAVDPENAGNHICVPSATPLPPRESTTTADTQPQDRCDALVQLVSNDPKDPGFLTTFAASDYAGNETYGETLVGYGVCRTLLAAETDDCTVLEPLGADAVAECRSMAPVYRFLIALRQQGVSPKTKDALKKLASGSISAMLWDILFEVQQGSQSCADIFDPHSEAYVHCRAVTEDNSDLCEDLHPRRRIPHCRALVELLGNLDNPRWDSLSAFDSEYFMPRYITDFAKGSINNCEALLTDRLYEQCQAEEP